MMVGMGLVQLLGVGVNLFKRDTDAIMRGEPGAWPWLLFKLSLFAGAIFGIRWLKERWINNTPP
jgi:hypothetical protein